MNIMENLLKNDTRPTRLSIILILANSKIAFKPIFKVGSLSWVTMRRRQWQTNQRRWMIVMVMVMRYHPRGGGYSLFWLTTAEATLVFWWFAAGVGVWVVWFGNLDTLVGWTKLDQVGQGREGWGFPTMYDTPGSQNIRWFFRPSDLLVLYRACSINHHSIIIKFISSFEKSNQGGWGVFFFVCLLQLV